MIRRTVAVLAAAATLAAQSAAEPRPRIAIIIDDIGYRFADGRRAIELPGPVAYAILPGAPHGAELADLADRHGREVLLHLPLEAANHDGPVEPQSITLDMSREALQTAFSTAIATIPNAVGVSNHQGSLITRHPGHMAWLMEEIRHREDLFFIDSYTTRHSVALQLAAEEGVPAVRRDIFLDHDRSVAAVQREFERLRDRARRNGYAIAIGHPFPETLEVLERELPLLEQQGIELVTISELLQSVWNRI
jgi:polysaccharide deacetylase 2 family uncharacterized protein YibQ